MANYIEYNDCFAYIASRQDLQAKIIAIDAIIEKHIENIGLVTQGLNGSVQMYELDDGQVRIKTIYRSIKDIVADNNALETMKQLYVNQLNGRTCSLRDKSTFRTWPWA